jgi:tripartite-type tricarboxylate transporter receptor subunit TctC
MRRRSLLAAAGTAGMLAGPLAVMAQGSGAAGWPQHAVRLVVPAPAGSSLDIVARLLAERLKERWAQPVVVDNKPGAGGLLGMDAAAKAAPDGHTLALGFNGPIAFAPFMLRKMPYDAARDLLPVVMTTSQPNVLAVHAGLPVRDVKGFIAWARERGGRLNYASLGQGSSAHLTMELFLAEAGLSGTHIPFNGSPPAALAVAQGEADATFMVAPALMAHVQAGKVRLLATSSAQRPAALKDLPTLAEAGLGQVESLAWNGLFTAAGTPAAVVQKIGADVNAVLQESAVRTLLEGQGLAPMGGSAAEFGHVVQADARRWGAIIQRLGLAKESPP